MIILAPVLLASLLSSLSLQAPKLDAFAQLQAAVELPKPEARTTAALRLAKKKDISIVQWIEAMQNFGSFEPVDQGLHSYRVKIWLEDEKETRELMVFVPSDYDISKPSPLLLLLHGSGGEAKQMFPGWQRLAEQQGYLLLAPTDPKSFKGYSFTQRERDAALQALRWMRLKFNVDENRIHVHGVSRGGHLTWDLGLRHRDRFASLIPAIGGPTWIINEGRNNMRFIENLWDMPIRDLQGSKDDYRLLRNLRQCFAKLEALGNKNAHLIEFEDLGHNFRSDTVDWAGFIDNSERTPYPSRLIVRAASGSMARNSWIRVDKVDRNVKEIFQLTVNPGKWNALDESGKANFVQRLAESKTGRVQGEHGDVGFFKLTMSGVKRVSLLVPKEWVPENGKVKVKVNKRTKTVKPIASRQVLILDFVERFDRSFLPVYEIPVTQ